MPTISKKIVPVLPFVLTLLQTLCAAQLSLYSAGNGGTFINSLEDGASFCTEEFLNGLTIRCHGSTVDEQAKFWVNGSLVRKQLSKPFFIAGSSPTGPRRWSPPTQAAIDCILLPTKNRYSANVSFICPLGTSTGPQGFVVDEGRDQETVAVEDSNPVLPARPSSLHFVPAGDASGESVALHTGMIFCPRRVFTSSKFSVICLPSETSRRAKFRVNGRLRRKDNQKPFFLTKEVLRDASTPTPWKNIPKKAFRISCELSDGNVQVVRDVTISCEDEIDKEEGSGTEFVAQNEDFIDGELEHENVRLGCLVLQAKKAKLPPAWESREDGVVFRPGDTDSKISEPRYARLYYLVIPPVTSRFAIVLDMTTVKEARGNDVWLRFAPGGIQIMRQSAVGKVTGWIRANHRRAGRALETLYFDFNPYSLSSFQVLQKGAKYLLAISGRSAGVIVHRIILFPCEGSECQREEWEEKLSECAQEKR